MNTYSSFFFPQLVPTILIAMAMNKKRVKLSELLFGVLISIGMVMFAMADFSVYPDANAVGIFLVSTSVVADAFLPNFQERVFEHGCSRVEVTYFTNLLSLVLMTISFTASGDLLVSCGRQLTA